MRTHKSKNGIANHRRLAGIPDPVGVHVRPVGVGSLRAVVRATSAHPAAQFVARRVLLGLFGYYPIGAVIVRRGLGVWHPGGKAAGDGTVRTGGRLGLHRQVVRLELCFGGPLLPFPVYSAPEACFKPWVGPYNADRSHNLRK